MDKNSRRRIWNLCEIGLATCSPKHYKPSAVAANLTDCKIKFYIPSAGWVRGAVGSRFSVKEFVNPNIFGKLELSRASRVNGEG